MVFPRYCYIVISIVIHIVNEVSVTYSMLGSTSVYSAHVVIRNV